MSMYPKIDGLPTQPGWYWTVSGFGRVKTVELDEDEVGLYWEEYEAGEYKGAYRPDETPYLTWHGPIPPPGQDVGGFGLVEIEEWAAWIDQSEGTEVSGSDRAICVAHAILEAAAEFDAKPIPPPLAAEREPCKAWREEQPAVWVLRGSNGERIARVLFCGCRGYRWDAAKRADVVDSLRLAQLAAEDAVLAEAQATINTIAGGQGE